MSDFVPETRYCTPELLYSISEVVARTDTPSWVHSVPLKFGDAGTGVLKADEWRSFATIYLPLALIKVWSSAENCPPSTRIALRMALDHTMSLVSAIILSCYRTTSFARAAAYRECMITYLRDLMLVYPASRNPHFLPNMHMSMHIFDFLLLFGPVHSWWTFPFE